MSNNLPKFSHSRKKPQPLTSTGRYRRTLKGLFSSSTIISTTTTATAAAEASATTADVGCMDERTTSPCDRTKSLVDKRHRTQPLRYCPACSISRAPLFQPGRKSSRWKSRKKGINWISVSDLAVSVRHSERNCGR